MSHRFFYHNFPRRRADSGNTLNKGLEILTSIRDIGFLLTPEIIEWSQPLGSNPPRVQPRLQQRVCFTELAPAELQGHADKFGEFAIEFDYNTMRALGGMPVFYVPRSEAGANDGNLVGAGLTTALIDAEAIVNRIAFLEQILREQRCKKKISFNVGWSENPEGRGVYEIDRDEAKNLIKAFGHAATPWQPLKGALDALLGLFYPADNTRHGFDLDYYRQREWRIAFNIEVHGKPLMRDLSEDELQRVISIDPDFFQRELSLPNKKDSIGRLTRVYPGINGKSILQHARRLIVPREAFEQVNELVSSIEDAPHVVTYREL